MTQNRKQRTANTGLAKVAVLCSAETFLVNQRLVLSINPESSRDDENRHLLQDQNHYCAF